MATASQVVPSHMTAQPSDNPKLKVWQAWPGSHYFCCDGRLMMGPDIGVTGFAAALTSAASVSFWIFVGPRLPLVYTLGQALLYALTMGFMFLTATTDPGVVPQYAASLFSCLNRFAGKTRAAKLTLPPILDIYIRSFACLPRALAQQSLDGRGGGRRLRRQAEDRRR